MFKKDLSFWIPLLLMGIPLSCSTTKKGLANKQYHALTTKYNVLFNGKEAFAIGEAILSQAFEENFYELLPVEPISLRGENFDETTIVPGFDRAEEKAVKAIQKHSININETQYNSQIDEAYLLLGKARYFDRRFFPALEAFNFLLESGANLSVYLEGKIWREKTNIRLKNIELAVQNLRPLVQSLSAKNKMYPFANATLADAFIQLKQMDSASFYIQRAAIQEPKHKNKARYLFISGQLLESLELKDSARMAYRQISELKRKAPRALLIQAKIKETLLESTVTPEEKLGEIERLLKNYENEPFEHRIHSAIAKLYLEQGKDSLALVYFDESLKASSIDPYTEIQNYQDLVAFYFDNGFYVETGQYLDRLLPFFESSSTRYKQLKRQRDNLSDVILYEQTVKETDSILGILSLSKEAQLKYYKNYIEEKQLSAKKELEAASEKKKFQLLGRSEASFYFYNSNLILQGKQNYLAKWGDRPNVDNWRSAFAIENISQVDATEMADSKAPTQILQETPESFVGALPQTSVEQDSIRTLNHKAYLQLGMIYKEKFKNYSLAQERLEHLLSEQTADEIKVQVLYHLFRMGVETNSPKSEDYKTQLVEGYPETPFAQLISDPENFDNSQLITPELLYKEALNLYKQQRFRDALDKIKPLMIIASGSAIEPKTALLKAHINGRLNGIEAWKIALAEIALNYSVTEEAKHANTLLENIEANNNLEETGVVYKNYKWIFPFLSSEIARPKEFMDTLKEFLKTSKRRWTVSLDPFNEDYTFVVVHGIRDPKEIKNIEANSTISALVSGNSENFVALATQYRTLIKNKNWKTFRNEGN
ncbi:hypothetical protein N9313_03095 [Flavobacteriaceae bacterium]|nr:hypothetical protein [Flavobacteriaceae bacterium]